MVNVAERDYEMGLPCEKEKNNGKMRLKYGRRAKDEREGPYLVRDVITFTTAEITGAADTIVQKAHLLALGPGRLKI